MSLLEQLGTNYGFVFPGQGSQTVGMGKSLEENSDAARELLDQANEVLGFDLRRMMFEGSEEELADTRNSQPAIYTVSAMGLAAMTERIQQEDEAAYLAPNMVAGHSLGQFTALLAAEVIDFATGLKLVRARGKFMAAAGDARPGAMAAVLGMDDVKLAELVDQAAAGDVLTIANLNCPGQTVISGEVAPMERFMELGKDAGARRIARLPISIASHSALRHFTPDFERNLSDELAKLIAAKGGVVQIPFGTAFVNPRAAANTRDWFRESLVFDRRNAERVAAGEPALDRKAFEAQWAADHPKVEAPISDVLDQIDYAVKLIGVDHVGIGSDFDGVGGELPEGLRTVADFPNLVAGMQARGHSDGDIRKILALLPAHGHGGRQNLLFSATFSDEIKQLANGLLHNPALIEVARRNMTTELVSQVVHPVDRARKRYSGKLRVEDFTGFVEIRSNGRWTLKR